jgi:hypothetical protein
VGIKPTQFAQCQQHALSELLVQIFQQILLLLLFFFVLILVIFMLIVAALIRARVLPLLLVCSLNASSPLGACKQDSRPALKLNNHNPLIPTNAGFSEQPATKPCKLFSHMQASMPGLQGQLRTWSVSIDCTTPQGQE